MAKKQKGIVAATGHKVEEFVSDLTAMMGNARTKAEGWIGQRKDIVKHLTELRDTATQLLKDLGHEARVAAVAGTAVVMGRRRGRPPASIKRKRPALSAEARAKISAAQKRRWAKVKAAEKVHK